MANPALDPAVHSLIYEYGKQGLSTGKIRAAMAAVHGIKVGHGTVSKFKNLPPAVELHYSGEGIRSDKKVGIVNWREWSANMQAMQKLKSRASFSQDTALIELGDGKHDVAVGVFSDQHIGSWGCDYEALARLTDELINTKWFYVALLGDVGQYSIKLRSVLEVSDNLIPPEQQTAFIQSWFDDIWHKVACSSWDNHEIQRGESQAGESNLKRIFSRRTAYFNGIGHPTFKVGDQIYQGAVSHQFRGRSMLNPVHACQRYMRFEGTDKEFAMMGDSHVPGMSKYTDGDKIRVAINAGSLQINSGFGKRYFSLTTHPVYPVIVFRHDRHEMVPFWSLREYLAVRGK